MTTADKIKILTAKDVEGVARIYQDYRPTVDVPFRRLSGGDAVVSRDRYDKTMYLQCEKEYLELWTDYNWEHKSLYMTLNVPYDKVSIVWAKYPGLT